MIADDFSFLAAFWGEKKMKSFCLLLGIHLLILPVTLFKELVTAY
jgi:hypothetical protein